MKSTVSVIVVARNEEQTIANVIKEAVDVLPKITRGYEILVNDDASTDNTPEILDTLARKNRHPHVYHQKVPLGIAGGLEFLYTKARCGYVYDLPGDGQYTIRNLPAMLQKEGNGWAIVVGKRIHKQYTTGRSLISFFFNASSRVFFGVDTIDAGSTKLCRRDVLLRFRLLSRGVYNERRSASLERRMSATKSVGCPLVIGCVKTGRQSGQKLALFGNPLQTCSDCGGNCR